MEAGLKLRTIALESKDAAEFKRRAATELKWYRSVGALEGGKGRMTGYYSPLLRGSFERTAEFSVPLYAKPPELVQTDSNNLSSWMRKLPSGQLVTPWSRREIYDGALAGRGLELFWTDDLFEAFLFEVQGAGSVEAQDENGVWTKSYLNFAAVNGRAWRSVGQLMKDKGVDPKYLSIPGMRLYFKERPSELVMLRENPRFVFFLRGQDGPYGSENTILVPQHSAATDPSKIPMGAMMWLASERADRIEGGRIVTTRFSVFAVAQDQGGAIKGDARVDYYFGEGEVPEFRAGNQNSPTDVFVALP